MDGGLLHLNAAQDPKAWDKAQTFAQSLVHLTSLMHAVALQHLRSDWELANLTPYRATSAPGTAFPFHQCILSRLIKTGHFFFWCDDSQSVREPVACHIISCFAWLSLTACAGELVAVVSPHSCLPECASQVNLPKRMLVLLAFRMLLHCSIASKGPRCTGCGFALSLKARLNKKANTTGRSPRPLLVTHIPPQPSQLFLPPCLCSGLQCSPP